jgi:hypothetical protein
MAPSSVTWQSAWHLARRHRSWRRARKYPQTPFLSARFFSIRVTSTSAKNIAAVHLKSPPPAQLRPGSPPAARPAPCRPEFPAPLAQARSLPPRAQPSELGRPEFAAAARSSPPPPGAQAAARSSANGRPPRATVGHRQVYFFNFLV